MFLIMFFPFQILFATDSLFLWSQSYGSKLLFKSKLPPTLFWIYWSYIKSIMKHVNGFLWVLYISMPSKLMSLKTFMERIPDGLLFTLVLLLNILRCQFFRVQFRIINLFCLWYEQTLKSPVQRMKLNMCWT